MKECQKAFQVSLECVSSVFQECFRGVPKKFLVCFKKLSRVFKKVQSVLQGWLKLFQWSCKWGSKYHTDVIVKHLCDLPLTDMLCIWYMISESCYLMIVILFLLSYSCYQKFAIQYWFSDTSYLIFSLRNLFQTSNFFITSSSGVPHSGIQVEIDWYINWGQVIHKKKSICGFILGLGDIPKIKNRKSIYRGFEKNIEPKKKFISSFLK